MSSFSHFYVINDVSIAQGTLWVGFFPLEVPMPDDLSGTDAGTVFSFPLVATGFGVMILATLLFAIAMSR
jgi:hypothetical protein